MRIDDCEQIYQIIINMSTECLFDGHLIFKSDLEFIGIINLDIKLEILAL